MSATKLNFKLSGSHVVERLVSEHPTCQVFVMDKVDYCSSMANLAAVSSSENYHFIKGDITSSDFVNYIMVEHAIDTIMHFAAHSHVDNSFEDSLDYTTTNVLGTHVLLEAAKRAGVARFIHVSTDEVYGEVQPGQANCTEDSILAPTNPYAATKAAAESLVMAYHKSFKLPVIITRSNNIYGPYQYPEKIIPKIVCAFLNGKKFFIHGDGSNSRHYLHAFDVSEAMLTILKRGIIGETYNIGSDTELSNLQLARYLLLQLDLIKVSYPTTTAILTKTKEDEGMQKIKASVPLTVLGNLTGVGNPLDGEERYLEFVADRPFNDRRYAIDSAKIHALGWRPRILFEDGVRQTIEWYAKNWDTWWSEDVVESSLAPHPAKVIVRREQME
ncbi:hypothetical protein HK100_007518 [Physocladia obscura]|uniref:NAD(P)-binding domain-containing protein n=1 Tax=Physocladia obscura TaxID=109957 RepID=A0AAD5T5C4_9FUNG|nr:hypothetical protein HK100_007518 [Physocladia obscura]